MDSNFERYTQAAGEGQVTNPALYHEAHGSPNLVEQAAEQSATAASGSQSSLAQQWRAADQASLSQPLARNQDGTYTTQFGDCLSSIADRALQDSGHANASHAEVLQEEARIIQANQGRYDSLAQNPDRLPTGLDLVIPGDAACPAGTEQHPQLGSSIPRQGNYYEGSQVRSYYPPDENVRDARKITQLNTPDLASTVPVEVRQTAYATQQNPVDSAYQAAMARTYGEYGTVNPAIQNDNAIMAMPYNPGYNPGYYNPGYYGNSAWAPYEGMNQRFHHHRFEGYEGNYEYNRGYNYGYNYPPNYNYNFGYGAIPGSGYYPGNESVITGPAGVSIMRNPVFPARPDVASSMGDLNAIFGTILPMVNAGAGIYMGIENNGRYRRGW